MNLLGIRLGLLLGANVPSPPPLIVTEALEKVEVIHKEKGRSGFQLQFRIGRGSPLDLLDHRIMSSVKGGTRVVLTVYFNAIPRVLFDGLITHQQLKPGNQPGETRLCITGEDVSSAMVYEEVYKEHAAQSEYIIVQAILGNYAKYQLIPMVIPPPLIDPPVPTERTPVQYGNDLEYLHKMADRFGYVFYVTPGPAPLSNGAYWGPPNRLGPPQPALTYNMGPASNVTRIDFTHDTTKPVQVYGAVQDRSTNSVVSIQTFSNNRVPLALGGPTSMNSRKVRVCPESGLTGSQALSRAQGRVDASVDNVSQVTGELDTLRYNDLLRPRSLVDVRGAGMRHDGTYYVKQVTHCIEKGSYKQEFVLSREGLGTMKFLVMP